jgi:hypothetical protein
MSDCFGRYWSLVLLGQFLVSSSYQIGKTNTVILVDPPAVSTISLWPTYSGESKKMMLLKMNMIMLGPINIRVCWGLWL